jgi:putative ABC transport system permease protein
MRETPIWRRYLRFLGSDPAADVEDELTFHFTMRVEDLMRRGLPETEARQQATREFGEVEQIRGELQDIGRKRLERQNRARGWESLGQDVRFAVRTLRKSPGFTAVAALTLAIGIGAGTAMFSVLNGVLLRELPVQEQDELVVLWTRAPSGASDHFPVSQGELTAFKEQTRTFESVAGVAYQGASEQALRDGSGSVTVAGTWVTGDFFPLLGVTPVHGRTLRPSDDVLGAEPVMVISHGFWQRYFGADPAAVGRVLERNGKHFTVVGVLPRGFEYPKGAEFWIPVFAAFPEEAQKSSSGYVIYDVVGRLRPGATVQQARQDYEAFLREGDAQRPPAFRGMEPVLTPLADLVTGDARATLWTAAVAVGLLLLIACINVANLLLIRGSARTQELAIRSALGAGRRRLIRQLLTESGVLALLGGVLGVLLAFAAVRVLVALAPPELPRREMITLDARVLAFAVGITAAAALLSGLLPAVLSAAGDLSVWLRGGQRTGSSSRGAQALRHGLVIGQVSLAIVVVVSAGLLVRSLLVLQSVDLGFNEERLLVVATTLPPDLLPERSQQVALQEEMLARVAAIPGVIGVASVPRPPFSGQGGWSAPYTGEGQAAEAQASNPMVNFEVIGPEYFRTLELPVRRGRAFTAQDRENAPRVAVVSEAVAQRTWPGEDPIGRRIKLGPPESPAEWHTVVGVVGETRYRELTDPQPSLYLPIRQFGGPVPMSLAIRTRADPAGVLPQVRQALQEVHPELMPVGGGSMSQLLSAPLARPRFSALLLGTFAATTLLLAAVGIYGVLAATVRQRTREIGIRLALGARVQEVRRLVLRQGMLLAFWGCAIGIASALFGARTLRSMLFGITPTDPVTFAAVVALILGTAALACYIPARRASRVDPVNALRAE